MKKLRMPAKKRLIYRNDLFDQGGLEFWIEMTGGKARLFAQFDRGAKDQQ